MTMVIIRKVVERFADGLPGFRCSLLSLTSVTVSTVIRSHALFCSLLCACCSLDSPAVPAQGVGVTDGDTITAIVDDHQIKVRLNGVDAPENSSLSGIPQSGRCLIWSLNSGLPSFLSAKTRWGRTNTQVLNLDGRRGGLALG
jgi:hypothetical protein